MHRDAVKANEIHQRDKISDTGESIFLDFLCHSSFAGRDVPPQATKLDTPNLILGGKSDSVLHHCIILKWPDRQLGSSIKILPGAASTFSQSLESAGEFTKHAAR